MTEALEPGASISAIARLIGIHPSQLFTWCRDTWAEGHYRSRRSRCEGVVASVAGAVIEIAIGGVVVRADVDVDEAHLQRVIRAVRSASSSSRTGARVSEATGVNANDSSRPPAH